MKVKGYKQQVMNRPRGSLRFIWKHQNVEPAVKNGKQDSGGVVCP